MATNTRDTTRTVHHIYANPVYKVSCRDCELTAECETPESAEDFAKHHINDDIGDVNPRPYGEHTLEITRITLVGRNV